MKKNRQAQIHLLSVNSKSLKFILACLNLQRKNFYILQKITPEIKIIYSQKDGDMKCQDQELLLFPKAGLH
jgi:hypothetical protein